MGNEQNSGNQQVNIHNYRTTVKSPNKCWGFSLRDVMGCSSLHLGEIYLKARSGSDTCNSFAINLIALNSACDR
jgi:hypothetical protein